MRSTKQTKVILSLIIVVMSFFGCEENQIVYPSRQMPAGLMEDALQISGGHKLFKEKCASCHGKPSEGRSDRATFFQPPAPDFTDVYYREIDPAYLYWRIEDGKTSEPFRSQGSVMPAWGLHLSEEQLWQMVAYLQTRAH